MSPVQFHSRPTVDVRHVMDQPKLTLQERTDRQTDRQTHTHCRQTTQSAEHFDNSNKS